jgi:hypothetical protein
MMVMRNVVLAAGLGCTALGLGNVAPAQEPEKAPPAAEQPGKPAKTTEQWITELGNESYRVRLQAEKHLRQMGKEALPGLRAAAERTDDSEVQWRAKRLVKQIEGGDADTLQKRAPRTRTDAGQDQEPTPLFRRWPGAGGLPDDVRTRFEGLFQQMERDFGVDVPRGRFFSDDFFRDLQQQIEVGRGTSQGMTMKVGPDGVRVEVKQKNEKGEIEEKAYEAPDLESFRQQYPGVLEQNGLGLQMWFDRSPNLRMPLYTWPMVRGQGTDKLAQPHLLVPQVEPPQADEPATVAPPPDDRRLGVTIRPEISEELREHLGLDDGVGLMVESVQPGTLAESLGLSRGDIVVRIGSESIGSAADVQKALGAIEANAKVEVHFLRKGAEKTATANKPAPASKPDDEPESKPERLERRAKKAATIR